MKTRPFGPAGIDVPVLGQGTWKLRDPAKAEAALRLGIDRGLRHIDTAELYEGSEEIVARAIAGRRDEVFLVSKVLPQNASRRGTVDACRRSLARLGTNHVDVYLLHWWSERHRIEDTMAGMGDVLDEGLATSVGVSNLDVPELERAQSALGRRKIVCDQVFYDLEHRHLERELLPYCQARKIALVGYSPFGSHGRVPGASTRGGDVLARVAAAHNASAHQVVLNFLAARPGVFLIPKAEDAAHVRANAAALDFELGPDELAALDAAFPVPKNVGELPTI